MSLSYHDQTIISLIFSRLICGLPEKSMFDTSDIHTIRYNYKSLLSNDVMAVSLSFLNVQSLTNRFLNKFDNVFYINRFLVLCYYLCRGDLLAVGQEWFSDFFLWHHQFFYKRSEVSLSFHFYVVLEQKYPLFIFVPNLVWDNLIKRFFIIFASDFFSFDKNGENLYALCSFFFLFLHLMPARAHYVLFA